MLKIKNCMFSVQKGFAYFSVLALIKIPKKTLVFLDLTFFKGQSPMHKLKLLPYFENINAKRYNFLIVFMNFSCYQPHFISISVMLITMGSTIRPKASI